MSASRSGNAAMSANASMRRNASARPNASTSYGRATWEIYLKTLRQVPRVPPDIIQAILIPLFFFALLSLQLRSLANLPGFPTTNYAAFLLPQIIVFTAFTSANGAGYGFVLEAKGGYLDKLRLLPIPHSAIVMGRLLAVGTRAIAQAALILIVAFAVGITIASGALGLLGVFALAACVAMAWAGLVSALGLLTRSPEAVEASQILFLPLTYLTTGSVPLELMDPILRPIVRANPVTYVTEGLRSFTLGTDAMGSLFASFGAALALLLAGILAANFAMKRLDRA